MPKRLTPLSVKNLKAGAKRREVPDGATPGLHLVIQPSGVRSWALRLRRPDGRSAKITLGRVDTTNREVEGAPVVGGLLTLPAARHLAAEIHRERAMGRDVAADAVEAKRRRRVEREELAASTFARAARDYAEYAQKNRRRWREAVRMLGFDEQLEVVPKGLVDRWRNKPVASVDAGDIYSVVN